jgi:hypothetical protein
MSAFRQSERLNEERILKDQVSSKRTVIDDGARPDTNDANNPKGQATIELPTTRAGVQRSDPGAEEEDAAAAKASTKRAAGFDKAHPEKHHARKPEGNKPPTMLARFRRSDVEADKEDKVADEADTDKVTKVADQRNLKRVDKADELDLNLLIKCHLPESIDDFLPSVVPGPVDSFDPPAWLMQAIEDVAATAAVTPLAPPMRFDLSEDSVKFNSELLKESNLDVEEFLTKHQDTTLNFGSEFRPIDDLGRILGGHPNFAFFSNVLENGMDHCFTEELSEGQRQAEVTAMMKRGNHQSVQEDSEVVAKLLAKDVLHGFSIPLSPALIPDLANSMVQPAGAVKQFSLQADGSREMKRRLTQDLSFPLTSPSASVNKRIDMEACAEMIYGWCLSRVIHFIVALRLACPFMRIFIMKYDYSDACRRVAHSPSAAAQSIIIFARVAYLSLRLTFGAN